MKIHIQTLFVIILTTLNSFAQVHFRSGKYIRYDGDFVEVNFSTSASQHFNYPNFGYRDDWNDYNTSTTTLKFFIKYGKCNHKLTKPFVFVEGVSFEKPVKLNTYSLTEYLNMYNGDEQVSNNQILVNARDSVDTGDWQEDATVGYSTFNWATLVTGIDAEGLDDGEPLDVQKSPELLQRLYDYGYDIIFVDFESGQQYMENNGFALSKALKVIKDSLDNNGSIEKLVVCGASMGGLVSRFAIRDLELNGGPNYNHCVGKFISFDSPQMGANINLGLQYFLQNFKYTNLKKIKEKYTKLTCPSASQLMLYSCLPDPIKWYSPVKFCNASPSSERLSFNNHSNVMSWPTNCKLFSIINGSRKGYEQNGGNFSECDVLFDGVASNYIAPELLRNKFNDFLHITARLATHNQSLTDFAERVDKSMEHSCKTDQQYFLLLMQTTNKQEKLGCILEGKLERKNTVHVEMMQKSLHLNQIN